jgi:hypothetical protein
MGMNSHRPFLNSQPSVELHVEELVLHGFAGSDRYMISDAVERELTLLLTNKVLMRSESSAEAFLDGGEIHLRPGFSVRQVGEEIGRSIFAGLIRPGHDNIHRNHSTQTNKKGK